MEQLCSFFVQLIRSLICNRFDRSRPRPSERQAMPRISMASKDARHLNKHHSAHHHHRHRKPCEAVHVKRIECSCSGGGGGGYSATCQGLARGQTRASHRRPLCTGCLVEQWSESMESVVHRFSSEHRAITTIITRPVR